LVGFDANDVGVLLHFFRLFFCQFYGNSFDRGIIKRHFGRRYTGLLKDAFGLLLKITTCIRFKHNNVDFLGVGFFLGIGFLSCTLCKTTYGTKYSDKECDFFHNIMIKVSPRSYASRRDCNDKFTFNSF